MTDPVADDFGFINKRAAELRKEMQDELERRPSVCPNCDGAGWVPFAYSNAASPTYVTCICGNPLEKPKP